MRRPGTFALASLAGAIAIVAASAGVLVAAADGPVARAQLAARIIVPQLAGDVASKFGIGPPRAPGTTCTRLGVFSGGEWTNTFGGDPAKFTYDAGDHEETAWHIPFFITPPPPGNTLLPLRAWLTLGYESLTPAGRSEGRSVAPVGGVIPSPAVGGGGWVVSESIRQPLAGVDRMEVHGCVQWSRNPYILLALDNQRAAYSADPRETITALTRWLPAAGSVAMGATPVLELPGDDGLIEGDADGFVLTNPMSPGGSLSLQAFPAEVPEEPEATANAVYRGTPTGQTSVTFTYVSPEGGWEPSISCETPTGPVSLLLPYRILPAVPVPFVLTFPAATISPNATPGAFTCEAEEPKGAVSIPPAGHLVTTVEDVLFDRESAAFETIVAIYNPTAQAVSLAGWSMSAALVENGKVLGYQDVAADRITVEPGGYARIVVRQPAAVTGYDRTAIAFAFDRADRTGGLRVLAGLHRR